MKYYEMILDKDYANGPKIMNWFEKINPDEMCYGFAHKYPKRLLFYVKKNAELVFPDIVLHPFLLVSDETQNVIKTYCDYIPFHHIVLMTKSGKKMRVYQQPFIENLKVMKSEVKEGVDCYYFEREDFYVQRIPIFQFEYKMEKHYVIRLDLLESILRRNQTGFTIKPVEIRGK